MKYSFLIERLRKELRVGAHAYKIWKKGDIEYRFAYYIVGRIGRAKGKWTWGQYCPLIPAPDLKKLLTKAKHDHTIL
ncbi:hypothetical protein HY479_00755 [Candidatus Uhrbacteria bacterium]|nr:hypothetical protein [Candidatus Uhrbacteria bacterium]